MKQLVQSVRDGDLRIVEAPLPQFGPTEVLVQTTRSLVSAGTEKAVRELASSSLLAKAKARPDLVRQVLKKARTEGLTSTFRAVQSRLSEDMPLGYSAAGVVLGVGEAVAGVRVGDRVATGSAGHATHQVVPGLLTAPIPDGVDDEDAAFATVGAIALNGLRLAEVGPGSRIAVIGLGLVGQLTLRLARASGCLACGIDIDPWTLDRARDHADLVVDGTSGDLGAAVDAWTRGRGVDAVLVTAATRSSAPMHQAAELARDRASVVLVGDVGMELDRRPLYEKELTVKVARSYGPGRYDPTYESLAVDYPLGFVRWTEGRNLEAVLDLLATGQLEVGDLVTHRFPFDQALDAYGLLHDRSAPYLGIELLYDEHATPHAAPAPTAHRSQRRGTALGLIGAGAFARNVLLPSLQKAGFDDLRAVVSGSGLSAAALVDAGTFEHAAATVEELLADEQIGVVAIATPHSSHADIVTKALAAGVDVWCEKPLALDADELGEVRRAHEGSAAVLWVGFNRRFSPALDCIRDALGESAGPLMLAYRVHAGPVPPGHWYHDRREGGRLLGEVCHFVDACAAVVGAPVSSVYATSSGRGEGLLDPDLTLLVRYEDGSQASIVYASSGHPGTAKERLEVLGRGHTVVLDDYRSVTVDGKQTWSGSQDKGHAAAARAFHRAVADRDRRAAEPMLASTAATLAGAASLLTGRAVRTEELQ